MTAHPQPPLPPPEAQLIAARRSAADPVPSMRSCAKRAGISPERWRQIETGVARVARGTDVPVRDVPAATIARMALVVGATPAELTSCGRADAATDLAALIAAQPEPEVRDSEMWREIRDRVAWLEQQLGKAPPGKAPPKSLGEDNGHTSRAV